MKSCEIVEISIILPVYNVYEWIDCCMESIVEQTYKNFEVILLDDGSTDKSGDKCEEWVRKDNRIRYIKKNNEGPAKTKNRGIKEAKGKYLVLIDPDDWIDKSYLEKLYKAATRENADIAECDIWRYDDRTGKKTYRCCYGNMNVQYTVAEHIKYGNTVLCKCMIKKELFIENDIWFPDCHSEARGIYALLIAKSEKIVNVHEALYYYRRFRKGSLTEKPRKVDTGTAVVGIQAFEYLINGFKKCELYWKYEKVLEESIKYKLSDLLSAFFTRRSEEEFSQIVNSYYEFVEKNFPNGRNDRYFTWGGYNFNRILWNLNLIHNPAFRYNFSSIISVMSPIRGVKCNHKNKYREIMLKRDITSAFFDDLKREKPDYIFIDFIEERFDIVEVKGGYITKSDAFDGAELFIDNYRVIGRRSVECVQVWKKACLDFIDELRKYIRPEHIVLIKNYLSEEVGDIQSKVKYENNEEIQEMNKILAGYYEYFEKHCDGVKVLEASDSAMYFTDKEYEYGAIPSHLNEIVNREIAVKIEGLIK